MLGRGLGQVKKLDSSGHEVHELEIRVLDAFPGNPLGLGTFARPISYIAGTPTLKGPAPRPATESADDPQNAIITLHARVNEVNVLFIATDKHGSSSAI